MVCGGATDKTLNSPPEVVQEGSERRLASLLRRNGIEIIFGCPKDWRRVDTRDDRCPETSLFAIAFAATVMFRLRSRTSADPGSLMTPGRFSELLLYRFQVVEQICKIRLQDLSVCAPVRINMVKSDRRKIGHRRRRVIFFEATHDEATDKLPREVSVVTLLETCQVRRHIPQVQGCGPGALAPRAMAGRAFLQVDLLPFANSFSPCDRPFCTS